MWRRRARGPREPRHEQAWRPTPTNRSNCFTARRRHALARDDAAQIVQHVRCRVGIRARSEQPREIDELVARGYECRLGFAVAHLAQPHGGGEAVAETFAADRLGEFTSLAEKTLDGLAGAPIAEAAIELAVKLPQETEIAEARAGRIHGRLGKRAGPRG
jgi:hypothetical protein